jgi:hypothetical protein
VPIAEAVIVLHDQTETLAQRWVEPREQASMFAIGEAALHVEESAFVQRV